MSFGTPLLQSYHIQAVKAEAQPQAKQREEQDAEHNSSEELDKDQKEHQATRERHINSHRKGERKVVLASSLAFLATGELSSILKC